MFGLLDGRWLAATIKSFTYGVRKGRSDHTVPDAAGQAKAARHAIRRVMIEVMLLHVAEIWIAEIVVVH